MGALSTETPYISIIIYMMHMIIIMLITNILLIIFYLSKINVFSLAYLDKPYLNLISVEVEIISHIMTTSILPPSL